MRKLICDGCGEEIDTSYMTKWDIHPAAKFIVLPTDRDRIDNDLEIELCISCAHKVADFIKNLKN